MKKTERTSPVTVLGPVTIIMAAIAVIMILMAVILGPHAMANGPVKDMTAFIHHKTYAEHLKSGKATVRNVF